MSQTGWIVFCQQTWTIPKLLKVTEGTLPYLKQTNILEYIISHEPTGETGFFFFIVLRKRKDKGRRTKCDFTVQGMLSANPAENTTAVSSSKFLPRQVVLYIAATLGLSYSIASPNTAAIKQLNHQFRAVFLIHAHRNSCSTALGAPFLWHLLGTNCLPGSCWHIQTVLLLQLLRAEAWKAPTYIKLQIL